MFVKKINGIDGESENEFEIILTFDGAPPSPVAFVIFGSVITYSSCFKVKCKSYVLSK